MPPSLLSPLTEASGKNIPHPGLNREITVSLVCKLHLNNSMYTRKQCLNNIVIMRE